MTPKTDTLTLIKAMRHLANDIQSGDGVANAAIAEAAARLAELEGENAALRRDVYQCPPTSENDYEGFKWSDVCEELERENAALREDKERLDLLNTLQWHGGAVTSPMMDGTRFRIQVGARPIIKGNTIRAAIDAAMKEVKP